MKVILSRKGFDSSYGGYPSPILPNGKMMSLPIPSSQDNFSYADLSLDANTSYYEYMRKISSKIHDKHMIDLNASTKCHLDPDIDSHILKDRSQDWRGSFGQAGASQTILEKRNVNHGDIFLFFGWFNRIIEKNHHLVFSEGDGFHAIFGYLQIEKRYYTADSETPEWMSYHPHMIERRKIRPNNCIYVATEHTSWNNMLAGSGNFVYSDKLRLSKEGMTRSKWCLPDFFKGLDISYHSGKSWNENYFQSAHRGQEFVIEEDDAVSSWAIELINEHVTIGDI